MSPQRPLFMLLPLEELRIWACCEHLFEWFECHLFVLTGGITIRWATGVATTGIMEYEIVFLSSRGREGNACV